MGRHSATRSAQLSARLIDDFVAARAARARAGAAVGVAGVLVLAVAYPAHDLFGNGGSGAGSAPLAAAPGADDAPPVWTDGETVHTVPVELSVPGPTVTGADISAQVTAVGEPPWSVPLGTSKSPTITQPSATRSAAQPSASKPTSPAASTPPRSGSVSLPTGIAVSPRSTITPPVSASATATASPKRLDATVSATTPLGSTRADVKIEPSSDGSKPSAPSVDATVHTGALPDIKIGVKIK